MHAIFFAFLLLFVCPLRISESEVPRKNPKKLYILEKAATDLLYPRSKSNDVHKNQNQGITRKKNFNLGKTKAYVTAILIFYSE